MYEKLTDNEILERIKNKDENALDFLINKYKHIVKIRARAYFIIGADNEDIIQEGMIGLYKAIRDYNTKDASFKTFAVLCIDRQIMTAIKQANRKKHSPLNSCLSLDMFVSEDEKTTYLENIEQNLSNPEQIVIDKENIYSLKSKINEELSSFEKKVLSLYLKGKSYIYISEKLNKNEKSIDNAIQRIRKKIYKLIH